MHVNGWDVIEKYLTMLHLKQGALARELSLSNSAISQFKTGAIRMNPRQIRKIITFLGLAGSDAELFYDEIFKARMMQEEESAAGAWRHRSGNMPFSGRHQMHTIPVVGEKELQRFVPALDTLDDFVRRSAVKRIAAGESGEATFAVQTSSGMIIFVNGGGTPDNGRLALALRCDGRLVLSYATMHGPEITLKGGDFGSNQFSWEPEKTPGRFLFIRPVCRLHVCVASTPFIGAEY